MGYPCEKPKKTPPLLRTTPPKRPIARSLRIVHGTVREAPNRFSASGLSQSVNGKGKIRKARNVTSIQGGITKSKTQKMIIMKNSPSTAVMSEPAPVAQGW